MSITDRLVRAISRADSAMAVSALSWGLEVVTGMSTKKVVGSFDTQTVSDWYARNGYSSIAGLGGHGSFTGVSVTVDTAFEVAAVLACVKVISEDMGSLPFFLYRRSEDGASTDKARDHAVFPILHGLANTDTSSGEFVEALTSHALLLGNGYALIQRNARTGEPLYLFPLMPQNVRLENDKLGRTVYVVRLEDGSEKAYAREDVFHLRGFTLNGIKGEDTLRRARQVVGLSAAGQQYAGTFFAHDASAGVVLTRPAGTGKGLGVDTIKAIKEAWVRWHQGLGRSHEPAILQDGMTYTRLDPDHQKLQMIEQRRFQIEEICRIFRMPPHKIADLSRSTNNNIESQGIEYVTNTLMGWRRRWRDAVHRCLLTRVEQVAGRIYADHNVEAFLQGDFAAQAMGFGVYLDKGVMKINEVRRLKNLNPVKDGDENRVQLNTVTIRQAAQQILDATTPPAPQNEEGGE